MVAEFAIFVPFFLNQISTIVLLVGVYSWAENCILYIPVFANVILLPLTKDIPLDKAVLLYINEPDTFWVGKILDVWKRDI